MVQTQMNTNIAVSKRETLRTLLRRLSSSHSFLVACATAFYIIPLILLVYLDPSSPILGLRVALFSFMSAAAVNFVNQMLCSEVTERIMSRLDLLFNNKSIQSVKTYSKSSDLRPSTDTPRGLPQNETNCDESNAPCYSYTNTNLMNKYNTDNTHVADKNKESSASSESGNGDDSVMAQSSTVNTKSIGNMSSSHTEPVIQSSHVHNCTQSVSNNKTTSCSNATQTSSHSLNDHQKILDESQSMNWRVFIGAGYVYISLLWGYSAIFDFRETSEELSWSRVVTLAPIIVVYCATVLFGLGAWCAVRVIKALVRISRLRRTGQKTSLGFKQLFVYFLSFTAAILLCILPFSMLIINHPPSPLFTLRIVVLVILLVAGDSFVHELLSCMSHRRKGARFHWTTFLSGGYFWFTVVWIYVIVKRQLSLGAGTVVDVELYLPTTVPLSLVLISFIMFALGAWSTFQLAKRARVRYALQSRVSCRRHKATHTNK